MNPITCGMAADLLPLYLDGCCSADSCAALEAHMDACPACRAQYAQLRRGLTPAAPAAEHGTDGIARALARKMRRRKRCLRALGAVLGVLLAVLLVFIGKTFVILGQPGGAASAGLPAGATDLAGRAVSGSAEEVGAYVFATGTARLVVSADALPDAPVTVRLCRCARRAKTPWSQRSMQGTGRASSRICRRRRSTQSRWTARRMCSSPCAAGSRSGRRFPSCCRSCE